MRLFLAKAVFDLQGYVPHEMADFLTQLSFLGVDAADHHWTPISGGCQGRLNPEPSSLESSPNSDCASQPCGRGPSLRDSEPQIVDARGRITEVQTWS